MRGTYSFRAGTALAIKRVAFPNVVDQALYVVDSKDAAGRRAALYSHGRPLQALSAMEGRGGPGCRRPGIGLGTLTAASAMLPRAADRHHLCGLALSGRWRGAEPRPSLHQLPALLEQIAAPVGGLDLVADGMGQRHLRDFGREAGALRGPIAERRSESVHSQFIAAHPPQHHRHRQVTDRPGAPPAGKDEIAVADFHQILENGDRRIR